MIAKKINNNYQNKDLLERLKNNMDEIEKYL